MSTTIEPADIGIDLGTTYSVIAIKGRVEPKPPYPEGRYIEECDVTIIPTPDGDPTFPSVFWVDPEDGRIVIGAEAKQKAEEGGAPIMFSKRSIGTTELLPLHGKTYTAQKVAEYILRHLKECAERALGRPVRRAVVTHPAYFEPNQVAETRAAAIDAGFDMRDDRQMMMEPAAAALAHTCTIPDDPLTIVTYDLGGGTFDVTVLQRKEGVVRMLAFDGDHLLGGYNFDKAIVQWLLAQLRAKGRTIPYDEANPDDRARRARLLHLAEEVKMKLSESRGKTGIEVRNQDTLVDSTGKKVQILEKINREQFVALIREDLEKTIECSRRAIAKAAAKADGGVCNPSHYVLVGGSTYGPWVADAVAAAFNVEPAQFNPDTCVAIGAALVAATLSVGVSAGGLSLALDIPASTPLPMLNICGTVLTDRNEPLPEAERKELRVRLQTPAAGPVPLQPDGSFIFADIPLQDGGPTPFRIEVFDSHGVRIPKEFSISYAPETVTGEIYPSVPKSIFVKSKDGLVLVAEEGATLPAKCEVSRPRLHRENSFSIPVIQEGEQVGTIDVSGLPEDAVEGSMITVSVEVTQQNRMQGTVTVTTPKGVVAATKPISIGFPPLRVPELDELERTFQELNAEREQEIFNTSDPDRRAMLEGEGRKKARKIEKLFAEGMGKERQEILREITEFRKLVQPPPEDMTPPRQQFRGLLEECQELLAKLESSPEVQSLASALKQIETKGNEAYSRKHHKNWASENANLVSLYQRLKKLSNAGGGGDQELPPTPILKDHFAQRVDQLRARLGTKRNELESDPRYATVLKSRLDAIAADIGKMEADIAKVDDELPPKQGISKCQLAYRPAAGLEKRINEAGYVW